jgi:CheY-like chemotaxis protein
MAEDDKSNIELFKEIFRSMSNVEVMIEENGSRGLQRIKKVNPEIIILNIKLAEISKIEICKRLREEKRFKNIPIIAMTAITMSGIEERVLLARFNMNFLELIRVQKFRKIIKQHLVKKKS